ncbi:MAG: EAL domain-containing protein [Thiohalophilus sp.]|uniref:putative bifunctional diguanylate cyclase/phosphodiesterase n=1 Tax=Thiohalophilus sp. TaxID=3028392 RepID=UPI00287042C2|nr:EAL domain-containing protein [Thiohalophilus sp.]MDR9436205.1 EAL domain-containing protein [Thiohalophilus sp.]
MQGWLVPVLLIAVLVIVSRYNFLLFHTLAELFAVMVAIVLAMVAWYTYGFSRNHFLMYLGIGYLWIGVLDLMHTLSYTGMGVLALEGGNASIQFWIVTRYLEAILLLTAPLFFSYRISKRALQLVFGGGSVIVMYLVLQEHLPAMFIEGVGLTPTKIVSEYLIVGLLLAAIIVITHYRRLLNRHIYRLMVASIVCTVAAELSFTLYMDLFSLPILVGHIFKFLSYWLIFLAVVRTSLSEPYQILTRASSTYDAVPDPAIVVDSNARIIQVNKAAEKAAGLPRQEMLEQDCHEFFHPRRMQKDECVVCHNIDTGTPLENFEIYYPESGEYREVTLTPFDDQSETRAMVHVMHNITRKKQAEAELVHSAYYDPLTDFPNRMLAIDRLEQAINHSRRFNMHTAVLFVDLDNFKDINDTLGHKFGDRVLIRMAHNLESCVRKSDTVARWGGDEFLIIIPGLVQLTDVERTVSKIFSRLAKPVYVEEREFLITASIGIAGYPDDGMNVDTMLSNADAAMYLAKQTGKNTYRFYTEGMNERAAERLAMEYRLRRALSNDELYMVYQPKVDIQNGYINGAEALMRWESPEMGAVSPAQFIPLAEESGQIVEIGDWAIHQVCRDLRTMSDHGFDDARVAINISSRQIRNQDFARHLGNILREHAVEPDRLKIEITESLLLEEDSHTVEVLGELREMGISLSLDDFGTGYSSLSYLKRFPFTEIKIDRSFIRDVESDHGDKQLCQAIIAMAESLKLKVVGEGVERPGQLEFLRTYGAHSVQGFLFSKPIRIEAFITLIERGPFSLSA